MWFANAPFFLNSSIHASNHASPVFLFALVANCVTHASSQGSPLRPSSAKRHCRRKERWDERVWSGEGGQLKECEWDGCLLCARARGEEEDLDKEVGGFERSCPHTQTVHIL
jgi:hypothetical protein